MVNPSKLTNLQVELLQMFAYSLPDEQLAEIRQLLAQYFLDKVDTEMAKLWVENGWNEDTIETWAKGHERAHVIDHIYPTTGRAQ